MSIVAGSSKTSASTRSGRSTKTCSAVPPFGVSRAAASGRFDARGSAASRLTDTSWPSPATSIAS